MLKKTLKKLIALTLATLTLVTSAMPVSASTLTPKKSHSKAEITEYVDYFNDITDRYAFRPDGYVPLYIAGTHDSQLYRSWQMTTLLQKTSGITSEQKEDMKKHQLHGKRLTYLHEWFMSTGLNGLECTGISKIKFVFLPQKVGHLDAKPTLRKCTMKPTPTFQVSPSTTRS